MNHEFMDALEQVEREKGISKEILLDAIETALASAYKRDQKAAQSIEVRMDSDSGALHVFTHKTVVEEVEDDKNEIALEDAQKVNPIYELGDLVEFEIFPKEFGRIAAQTAKQVVVQRIREAERGIIYEDFVNRVGDLITGIIQRFEQRNIFVDLGRIEGILPANEQMPNEHYEPGTRLKTFVVEVKKTTKGPQVLLSRTRVGLLKRLFELEVPEIQDGLVEIKSVSREPGFRSKIAVYSKDHQIDPVGACVGARGVRVQMIVRELKGEKIDIIPWSADPIEFIINALSPAKVSDVKILPSKKIAIVIVPDFQLSLAIGKEGQNARLAAKLTGWKIDIKSETQAAQQIEDIERLIRDEIGFKEIPVEVEAEPQVEAIAEHELTELVEKEPEKIPDDDEEFVEKSPEEEHIEDSETSTEELMVESGPEEDEEEEEEEEIVIKKKPKKSKGIAKHLVKIELDGAPISLDEGYFFSDVLEDKTKTPTVPEAPAETDESKDVKPKAKKVTKKKETLDTSEDVPIDNNGFTIGQLLGGLKLDAAPENEAAPSGKNKKGKSASGKGQKKGDE